MTYLRTGLCVGTLSLAILSFGGCGIWPVMSEDNGRSPLSMGKSDQVMYPWAKQPVHLSEGYGDSYRYAVESQLLNPQSAKSLDVVEGIDGVPVKNSMTRYQDMFKTPPFSIVSSGGGKKK